MLTFLSSPKWLEADEESKKAQATFASYKAGNSVSGCYGARRISSSDTPSANGPEMAAKLIRSALNSAFRVPAPRA